MIIFRGIITAKFILTHLITPQGYASTDRVSDDRPIGGVGLDVLVAMSMMSTTCHEHRDLEYLGTI